MLMDTHSKKQRSYNMSRIKSRNTKPEIIFRKYVWSKGIRGYRVKNKTIGKPDLYFSKKKIAVFIDGCFWHKCPKCFVKPKSNNEYWDDKIKGNIERDKQVTKELKESGVIVIRLWEHEIKENIEKSFEKLLNKYEN